MNVYSIEFKLKAEKVTGLKWDFTRLLDNSYQCCVESCFRGRLYGHWVCSEHLLTELKHFEPKNDYERPFWSHYGKDKLIKELERAETK